MRYSSNDIFISSSLISRLQYGTSVCLFATGLKKARAEGFFKRPTTMGLPTLNPRSLELQNMVAPAERSSSRTVVTQVEDDAVTTPHGGQVLRVGVSALKT